MGIIKKLFGKESKTKPDVEVTTSGNTINIGNLGSITFGNSTVGNSTGSNETDFYVYEWFIKDTGEIFYVGKGRGDRYKEYHERAYDAEKIRKLYDTDVKFVAKNLSEDEALEIETKEMSRILNETNDCLTNLITPLFTNRKSGHEKSSSTPAFCFETAPTFYAREIDEHYFGIKGRPYDAVNYSNLAKVHIITKGVVPEEMETIYGGNYESYYNDVVNLLKANGNTLLSSKYAKSVTAWIYPCSDLVINYDIDEKNAEDRVGHKVPCYHLIDVWKLLKAEYSDVSIPEEAPITIHPINDRIPLSKIKNKNNWEAGFDAGFKYWEKGDVERKAGNLEEAIQLFDKARANGYFAPALYQSYAMAYRKLKDLDNEIAILEEGIARYREEEHDSSQIIIDFETQRTKAIAKLKKKK